MPTALIVGTKRQGSLEKSYAWGLSESGWQESIWDPQAVIDKKARGGAAGRVASRFLHVEAWVRKANLVLFDLVEEMRPDLLLVIGTEGIRPGTLAQLKVRNTRLHLSCLYPDAPHNLTMERILCLPAFDSVFTVSPAWVPAFEKLGASSVQYLPLAADPRLHQPQSQTAGRPQELVSFIGSWSPDREAFIEELGRPIAIWGGDSWRRHSRPGSLARESWRGRPAIGKEFSEVCSHSRIMLNPIHVIGWPGPNMRVFEHAACKAFSLTTRTPAISEIFEENRDIACYGSAAEAREKIDHYLPLSEKREEIAAAGYELVLHGGHTYIDRAQTLLRAISC